jgi:hypothetical protein
VPAAGGLARENRGSEPLSVTAVRSWRGGGGPEEAGQFAGDGDGRDVVRLAAVAQAVVDAVQAMLGP